MKRYSGVLGIAIFIIVSSLIVIFNFKGVGFTVSNHTSMNLLSTLSFCIFCTIATLLITYSLLFYLPQKWGLGKAYKIIASLVSLSFLIACIFPNDPSVTTIHDLGGWGIAFSGAILMMLLLFSLWTKYNIGQKIINCLAIIFSLTTFGVLILDYGLLREYILVFETGVIALLFLIILLLIFCKPVKGKNE